MDASQEHRVTLNQPHDIASLWFEAGLWYYLLGDKVLSLGSSSGNWVSVDIEDAGSQGKGLAGEQNIETATRLYFSPGNATRDFGTIINQSQAGLRFGNELQLDLGGKQLWVRGNGATHFAHSITGHGDIYVGADLAYPDYQPHLILSAATSGWSGNISVGERGFLVAKVDKALGSGSIGATPNGTIGFRSHVGAGLSYTNSGNSNAITASGRGIIRREDHPSVGAIYNDGGLNVLSPPVNFDGETWFGSRGDRDGGLILEGIISGTAGSAFVKVAPGLIELQNGSSAWSGPTILRDGVLRLNFAPGALFASTNVQFDGQGAAGTNPIGTRPLLELNGALLPGGTLNANLGIGAGQLHWKGSGGFSAYAQDVSVALNGGGSLSWGLDHFVRDGSALLLGSRYANSNITFTNSIVLGGGQREVRVERGEGNAQAIIAGVLSGAGGGLTKTGRGLLRLDGANTYTGATQIVDGALLGNLGSSNIEFHGGVLGLLADIAFKVGTGAGEFQWLQQGGGFAAYGGAYSVFGPAGGLQINWGTAYMPAAAELRFGHYSANSTVLWGGCDDATAIDLLFSSGKRTIRVERGYQSYISSIADVAIIGAGTIVGPQLEIFGDGRLDIGSSTALQAPRIDIRGAELRLNEGGQIIGTSTINISHGGRLFYDDFGKYNNDSTLGGAFGPERLATNVNIFLDAGELSFRRKGTGGSSQSGIGELSLIAGWNTIYMNDQAGLSDRNKLYITSLLRLGSDNRSTLHLDYQHDPRGFSTTALFPVAEGGGWPPLPVLELPSSAAGLGVSYNGGDAIIPWLVVGTSWGRPRDAGGGKHFIEALPNSAYDTSAPSSWDANKLSKNMLLRESGSVATKTDLTSLIISGAASSPVKLDIATSDNSGLYIWAGLMTIGAPAEISSSSTQSLYINTQGNAPGYVHTFSDLSITGKLQLNSHNIGALVKTQKGALILDSDLTANQGMNKGHYFDNLFIYGGRVELRQGRIHASRVIVGDGAGRDELWLPANSWESLRGYSSQPGQSSITLHGTPYDPRGPEHGGGEAILRTGGNTKLHLKELHIKDRGTIDWVGGEVGEANILWLDNLTFNSTDARLFMRNWYEYEDLLLVKKANFSEAYLSQILPQIIFEGYEDYTTTYRVYDKDYFQITPFGMDAPEPETYGALLGALGLGLALYRRQRRRGKLGQVTSCKRQLAK